MRSTQNNHTTAIYNEYSGSASYHNVNVELGDNMGTMNEAVKEYAANQRNEGKIEGKIEIIKNMLKDNVPLEIALKYTEIDRETYEKYTKS